MSQKVRQLVSMKYQLPHHAKGIQPVVDALLYVLAQSGLTHRFGKVKTGENSRYLDVTVDGKVKRFHLRYRKNPDRLVVNEGYYKPQTVAVLTPGSAERDVIRWVATL